jgi:DNA repair protein SbcC/Rad50
MRPLRLELKNFTAYRERQVLDFEDFELFAITGPTGSGKSSLLDALSYALYGKAPRVGKGVSQLIAQGQPRLSVLLEFEVDGQRYRVARETPAKGASSIRLERQIDGQWASAGDGADRINDANEMIEKLVGLDYVGFTRSVVLPQGEFAEFLAGDPKDRRRILTELMDLGLFQRMAARAGEIAREEHAAARAKEEVLARQYAGVDEVAVKEGRARAKLAKARSEAMAEVERSLDGLAKESERLERRIEALDDLGAEVRDLAESAEAAVAGLQAMLAQLDAAGLVVTSAEERATSSEVGAAQAATALAEGEAAWGSLESLATLRASLEQFAGLEERIEAAEVSRQAAQVALEARGVALEGARQEASDAAVAMERAASALAEAEAEHEQAHRADLVGALTRGKRVGDPCPVCDRPLEEVRKVDTRELTRVKKILERAREAASQAEARWSKAERDAALAEREIQIAEGETERAGRDLEALRADRLEALSALEEAFGQKLPDHPVNEVDGRLHELRARRQRVDEAGSMARQARSEAVQAKEASRDVEAGAANLVGSLRGLSIPAVIRRARQCAPDVDVPRALVAAIPSQPGPALESARGMAGGLRDLMAALTAMGGKSRTGLKAIVERARQLLPDEMPKAMITDVLDLLDAARTLAKDLVAEAAEARSLAQRLAQQVKERKELEREVRARAVEAAVFNQLAGELKANRIIDFLQGEALELLAAAGSERLLFLSQGRYLLAFEGDEFYVEDRQNGDERRSVRTLSGGETFLASLALALALSEQIQSLAVTHRARLQSLFIDEGFGALDPESLEIATEALSQLGGNDRMVGVITHVSELAERLPVRIEVRKLSGGSRLEVVS